jgi:hypothetical protein
MSEERVAVSVDEALKRLAVVEDYDPGDGPKPCVHTFRSSAIGLLGAHWAVEKARQAMEKYGVTESGEQAQAMNHGLVVIDDTSPVFFETVPSGVGGERPS